MVAFFRERSRSRTEASPATTAAVESSEPAELAESAILPLYFIQQPPLPACFPAALQRLKQHNQRGEEHRQQKEQVADIGKSGHAERLFLFTTRNQALTLV